MTIQILIIIISWVIFLLVWGITALNVKKDVQTKGSWYWSGRGLLIRLVVALLIVVYAVYRGRGFNHLRIVAAQSLFHDALLLNIGAVLVVFGVALAVWARFHLGRNWTSHPSLKKNHELVTSGPYKVIRHPIYTGILLAMLGSGLGTSMAWLIPFVFGSILFVRRIFKEEQIMTKEFPDQYPEYKKKTWALVPWIW